ncbi:SDR family oxidoreductase [Stutzerimonas urumqiensis]|uniref:SDR family oxidoreductase n=1 Tax=Stutzerimonas urumqiensis TaxID=638269 RepID=UPI003BACCAE5
MASRVILITGCSSGIGRALAEAFRENGDQVWATARKDADVQALNAAGFEALRLDVDDPAAIRDALAQIERQAGRLDVLINNAGYGAMGPLLDLDAAALQRQFATNAAAPVSMVRASFDLLRRSRGLVINIGSVSGVLVTPFAGAYCASKAAIHALSQALRMELQPFGIRVMEVQPGAIESRFGEHASDEAGKALQANSPWWPLRDQVAARAGASQQHATPARHVAQAVVRATRDRPPRILRIGRGSRLLPFMARWLPAPLVESLLCRRFGLDQRL